MHNFVSSTLKKPNTECVNAMLDSSVHSTRVTSSFQLPDISALHSHSDLLATYNDPMMAKQSSSDNKWWRGKLQNKPLNIYFYFSLSTYIRVTFNFNLFLFLFSLSFWNNCYLDLQLWPASYHTHSICCLHLTASFLKLKTQLFSCVSSFDEGSLIQYISSVSLPIDAVWSAVCF